MGPYLSRRRKRRRRRDNEPQRGGGGGEEGPPSWPTWHPGDHSAPTPASGPAASSSPMQRRVTFLAGDSSSATAINNASGGRVTLGKALGRVGRAWREPAGRLAGLGVGRVTRNCSQPARLSTLLFLRVWACPLPHRGPGHPHRFSAASSACAAGITCAGSRGQEAAELGSGPRTEGFSSGTRHST